MATRVRKTEQLEAGAETLLQQTLSECDQAASRLGHLLRLANALVAVIPADRRIGYLHSIARFQAAAKAERAEPINDNILVFLKGKPKVTASEVRDALTGKGLTVDQKQVANSLDYLTRRGQLERIDRGEYRINPAVEAEIDRMLTERYGRPTYRGLPPGMVEEPGCY